MINEIKISAMEKLDLTAKEKAALELRHKQSRDVKESDRIKAILLRSENWTIPMIATKPYVNHESTVTRHINDYLTSN
ncbi:MAG: transposase [Francisellaceae bacterium]|nr:transposase [Francisellaceae bacterium]